MAIKRTAPVKKLPALPLGVTQKDLERPTYKGKKNEPLEQFYGGIPLYFIESWGWIICTLAIANGQRYAAQYGGRSYGIRVDNEELVRVGAGPHVLHRVTVYPTNGNAKRLEKLLAMHDKGAGKAGLARDKRSSRSARTSLRRGWPI